VCGKSARTVRREGRPGNRSSLPLSSSEALGGDNSPRLPFTGAHPSGFRSFSRCPCAHFDTGLRSRKNRNDGSLVLDRSLDRDFETGLTRAVLTHPGDGQETGDFTRTNTKRHDPGLELAGAIPSPQPSSLSIPQSAFRNPHSEFPTLPPALRVAAFRASGPG